MQGQSSDSHARAAERLLVAVVNQAILDVLEHGEEAEDAERWLLSKDFDALQSLFRPGRLGDRIDFTIGSAASSRSASLKVA